MERLDSTPLTDTGSDASRDSGVGLFLKPNQQPTRQEDKPKPLSFLDADKIAQARSEGASSQEKASYLELLAALEGAQGYDA